MSSWSTTRRQEAGGRYVEASLPLLPFVAGQFGLTLCSHFLFLYSERHSLQFHIDSLVELCRVAREARVFPLLDLSGYESMHVEPVMSELARRGYEVARRTVAYEFQRGGNEMLVVKRPAPAIDVSIRSPRQP